MNTRSTIVVKLPEELNAKHVRSLLRQLKPVLKLDQPSLILDLSEVCDIDSTGLDLLLRCMVEVANHDGSLKLVGISPTAATVLEITRMDGLFQMFPSVADAVSTASTELPHFDNVSKEQVPQPVAA